MSKEVFKGIYKSKDRYMQANQYLKSLKFLGHVDLEVKHFSFQLLLDDQLKKCEQIHIRFLKTKQLNFQCWKYTSSKIGRAHV